MIYIRFLFPFGRYHATPWGSHVNEGEVEWPPSPWRLFRALLSVGFTHLQWTKVPDDFELLLDKLSGCHPAYSLPAGTAVHTRHYMPIQEGSKVKTAKIFDTALRITGNQGLWMRFDIDLTSSETDLLNTLLQHLAFIGRAESWVDAELMPDCSRSLEWVEPNRTSTATPNARLIRVLSTQPSRQYLQWRSTALARTAKAKAATAGKTALTSAQMKKLEQTFPSNLRECLLTTTSALQSAGWSQPPGTVWIDYLIPQSPLGIQRSTVTFSTSSRATTALMSLCSDSVRGRTLPHRSMGVFVAENMHRACVAAITKLTDDPGELITFTGRDAMGQMLAGHRHSHFIPLCLQASQDHIDHILVFSRDGLSPIATRALAEVESIYAKDLPKVHVTLLGAGDGNEVKKHLRTLSSAAPQLFEVSQTFESVTPYVASRHLKLKNDKYRLEDNVADECGFRGLPIPRVTVVDRNQGKYRIARIGVGRQPPQAEGWILKLEFETNILEYQLPLALGYGSHFGLGLFRPLSTPPRDAGNIG